MTPHAKSVLLLAEEALVGVIHGAPVSGPSVKKALDEIHNLLLAEALAEATVPPARNETNRYCHASMCLDSDKAHEHDCPQGRVSRTPCSDNLNIDPCHLGDVCVLISPDGKKCHFLGLAKQPLTEPDFAHWMCAWLKITVPESGKSVLATLRDTEAARYRYLRDTPIADWPVGLATSLLVQKREVLDAEIDSAISEVNPKGGTHV